MTPEPCPPCAAGVHVFCDGFAKGQAPNGEVCPCCPTEEKK